MSWCTIESDPGVFTELIQQIGVKGVQVEEFYDIDQASFDKAKPIYGLIFLFKWQKDEKDARQPDPAADHVFFAKQVINNACATQAIINVLLNRPEIELGPELTKYKQFAEPLPADIRGMAMQNSAVLRTVHNSFARPDPFEAFHDKKAKDDDDDDDAFHFVGYVPIADAVYELDGLKGGPIKVGECKGKDWLEVARGALQERIGRYAAKEVRFNVMGLVKNRKDVLTAELQALEAKQSAAGASAVDAAAVAKQIDDVKEKIAGEDARFAAWRAENVRRRHNYVPFAFGLLKALAEKGKLKALVDASVKANEDRKKKKEDDKKKAAAAAAAAAAKPAASTASK